MSKKAGPRRKTTARGKQAATKDLTTHKRSSVERGEATGGAGKSFLIFASGPDGTTRGTA